MEELLKSWNNYKEWVKEQETGRTAIGWESAGKHAVKATGWEVHYDGIPTFEGFMEWLTNK